MFAKKHTMKFFVIVAITLFLLAWLKLQYNPPNHASKKYLCALSRQGVEINTSFIRIGVVNHLPVFMNINNDAIYIVNISENGAQFIPYTRISDVLSKTGLDKFHGRLSVLGMLNIGGKNVMAICWNETLFILLDYEEGRIIAEAKTHCSRTISWAGNNYIYMLITRELYLMNINDSIKRIDLDKLGVARSSTKSSPRPVFLSLLIKNGKAYLLAANTSSTETFATRVLIRVYDEALEKHLGDIFITKFNGVIHGGGFIDCGEKLMAYIVYNPLKELRRDVFVLYSITNDKEVIEECSMALNNVSEATPVTPNLMAEGSQVEMPFLVFQGFPVPVKTYVETINVSCK